MLNNEIDQRGEWWQALNLLRSQLTQAGQNDFAAYVDKIQQLVESSPKPDTLERLAEEIPSTFRSDWQYILDQIDETSRP